MYSKNFKKLRTTFAGKSEERLINGDNMIYTEELTQEVLDYCKENINDDFDIDVEITVNRDLFYIHYAIRHKKYLEAGSKMIEGNILKEAKLVVFKAVHEITFQIESDRLERLSRRKLILNYTKQKYQ